MPKLTAEQQKALDTYLKSLGVPPGPPTQQGIYATPEFTGDPYPTAVIKPVEENQEPPEGWPRNPIFNGPGDVPGPPVQFGPPIEPTTVKPGEGFTGIGMPENDIFYFHPDHLGSTSYITSRNGSISQHVEYIAFGEVLFEEHSSSFSSPYLFNGKELDRETNLSYYGARYLDMKTSLWLSVDMMAEKMQQVGSYVFAFNSPVKFIDPDGNEPIPSAYAINPWFTRKAWQWYSTGGVYDSKTFNAAAVYSTQHLRASAYQSVYQRNAYYNWAQSQADAKGYNSKWFGAAQLVTGLNAVGATGVPNLWVIKDNTEAFLKGVNTFLFSHNMKNAKDLLADGKLSVGFTDANGTKQSFQGLTGMALDNKMVEFEQSKVQEYINSYKKSDLNSIIKNINDLFTGNIAKTIGPGAVNDVMKESFNGGKSFNFKNYADRVKLGQELIKKAHNE